MKQYILCILFLVCATTLVAQTDLQKKIYLFDNFTEGKALLKNKAEIATRFNYDRLNRQMHYYNQNERMILEGIGGIDTIFISNRKFIPYQNTLMEVLSLGNGNLFIDWGVRMINKGKKGAMGTVTHAGTVNSIDVLRMQDAGVERTDNYIYDVKSDNNYYIRQNNELKKFNNQKTLLKLVPKDQEKEVKGYIKEEKIDFQNIEDVVKLLNQLSN